ncbi:MAG: apolipoprotein N-acyltransferase [Deltaproteobacteria bacterium]|nr:apolipoprotein N-acyltransferase [Deltaproteobacteria bacterium]
MTGNGGPAPVGREAIVPGAPVFEGRRALALAAMSGAALALAFPIVDWGPVAWIALVPLLLAALGRGTGAAFRAGWLAGVVFYLATLYWLVFTIGTYTNLSPLVSVGPLLLLCAFLALGFGIVAAACEWARRAGVELALVAPPAWVVVEWIRTYVLGGFPWVSLGYSQYRATYLVQFVEVTGVYGLSALVVLVNVVVYTAVRRWLAGEAPSTRAMLALASLLAMLVGWGYWRVHDLAARPAKGTLRVGFIQGNVPQDVKWDPAYQEATIARYEALTREAVAGGAELVVWPETAAPFFFQQESDLRDRILDLARRLRVWLVVGSPAFSYDHAVLRMHNRVYLVGPDGTADQFYDKMELVPFGEYVPLKSLFFFVDKVVEGVGDFRAGDTPVVFRTTRGNFGTLICYEGIFPDLTRRFVDGGADFLVNITNDAWFGRTSAPYQHLAMATLRTIENRVPLVRVANTGFSAMVDSDGTIRWRTGLFESAWRVDTISWVGIHTFYTRFGDVFVYGCLALLVLVAVVGRGGRADVAMEET